MTSSDSSSSTGERQAYMNGLWQAAMAAIQVGNEIYARAVLDSYDAKLSAGWPRATNIEES